MLGEQGVADVRDALRTGEVGRRQETAQAPPPDLAAGQEHEPGTTRPRPDASQVLLDRIAIAGQSSPFRTGAGRATLVDRPPLDGPFAARRTTPWPAGRDHDTGRVGDDRIEQFDLDADDRMEPRLLGRGGEPDRAIEAVAIRGGEARQTQLPRPRDQVVRC